MSRCTTALNKCVGPKKAPRICATKWRKSATHGKKKPDEKSFVARGLTDDEATEACGETCVGCEGADAPFKAFDPSEPRDETGKWTRRWWRHERAQSRHKVDALRDEMGVGDIPFEQRQALDMYTSDSHIFNERARLGPGPDAPETQHLDKLVNSYKLPHDVTVYRTVGWQRTKDILDHLGGSFSDPGFMSATLDKSKIDKPGTYIEIQIPKDSHAFPVGSLSEDHPDEAEILFPRNSRLQIVSHEPRSANTERFVARLVT